MEEDVEKAALPGSPSTSEAGKNRLEPLGIRGHCSAIHSNKLYLYGGYHREHWSSEPRGSKLEVFDFTSCEWSTVSTSGEPPEAVSGACSVVIGDCLYLFGGWHRGWRNDEVHELNLTELRWKRLADYKMKGRPLCKDKAGMVDYGEEMLCVFGGYGHPITVGFVKQSGAKYVWDPSSTFELCWTNELHLFQIKSREWISPELIGKRPPPCAAFSFTRVDRHRVVLFGGRQLEERTDQLYLLDMDTWHWSGLILPNSPDSPWPRKCSFHAACSLVDPDSIPCHATPPLPCHATPPLPSSSTVAPCHATPPLPSSSTGISCHATPPLPSSPTSVSGKRHLWLPCQTPDLSGDVGSLEGLDPKLLVLWGMNNDGDPVEDVWMLNVTTLTWKKLDLPDVAGPSRIWHTACSYHVAPHAATVLVVGGASSNLFAQEESQIQNVRRTTLLDFGKSDDQKYSGTSDKGPSEKGTSNLPAKDTSQHTLPIQLIHL